MEKCIALAKCLVFFGAFQYLAQQQSFTSFCFQYLISDLKCRYLNTWCAPEIKSVYANPAQQFGHTMTSQVLMLVRNSGLSSHRSKMAEMSFRGLL